jgi:hypothetical protein
MMCKSLFWKSIHSIAEEPKESQSGFIAESKLEEEIEESGCEAG